MVEVLSITMDRRPKGRPRKKESQTIEKIGCAYFNLKNSMRYWRIYCERRTRY
ncbi:MAG: hypothetical protein U9O91_00050 [Candidatus Caldatribacteriota bacterium]|nr:hypothetical protein [Candidatus Caldatribacteriota bacterium]